MKSKKRNRSRNFIPDRPLIGYHASKTFGSSLNEQKKLRYLTFSEPLKHSSQYQHLRSEFFNAFHKINENGLTELHSPRMTSRLA